MTLTLSRHPTGSKSLESDNNSMPSTGSSLTRALLRIRGVTVSSRSARTGGRPFKPTRQIINEVCKEKATVNQRTSRDLLLLLNKNNCLITHLDSKASSRLKTTTAASRELHLSHQIFFRCIQIYIVDLCFVIICISGTCSRIDLYAK
jgi:hypothetical protein